MPRTLLQHALTWLSGLVVAAEFALLLTLPAASQTPPTGPFASLEAPGRTTLAITLALAIPYAFGRLVSRHTSRPFILLLSALLSCLGALLALALGDYLDPYVQIPHAIACIAAPFLIAISLELHGIECFERPEPPPFDYDGQRTSIWNSGDDHTNGLPNPLLLCVAGPFVVAAIAHAVATRGIHAGTPHTP